MRGLTFLLSSPAKDGLDNEASATKRTSSVVPLVQDLDHDRADDKQSVFVAMRLYRLLLLI